MTAFDNDRWEAERKARLERVGDREVTVLTGTAGSTNAEEMAAYTGADHRFMTQMEKAARAASDVLVGEYDTNCIDPREIARAVLMAVREPDEAVVAAVRAEQGDCNGYEDNAARAQIKAFVDAILANPKP
jgi:hypothetical protein